MRREPRPPVARWVLAVVTVFAVLRAGALLLIAEGFAQLIAEPASWPEAVVPAAAGVLLRAVASWATGLIGRRAAAEAKAAQRSAFARHVVGSGLGSGSVAALAGRGLEGLDAFYVSVVPAAVSAVVLPLGLGLRVLTVDPVSALILALTLPLVPVFMILIGLHSRDRVAETQASLDRLADHVGELARGLPVLVGLGRDGEQAQRLAAIQAEHSRRTREVLRTALLSALALELLATLSVAVVAVFLGVRLVSGEVTLVDALIVLLLAPECFTALRETGAAHHAAQDGTVVLARIRELVAGRRDARPPRLAPRVEVRRLGVHYRGRRRPAFGGVTMTVAPGEVVALSGPSGSGKSTLLAALAGVLDPTARVQGVLARPEETGYAPQDPRTTEATVRAELELHAGDRDVDGLLAELRLEPVAGMDPALLSPGELRRLAVARALARVDRGAGVLLLDEPTAHLDAATAALVRRAVLRRRSRVATLLVSHDPATLGMADRLVALGATGSRPADDGVEPAPPALAERLAAGPAGGPAPWRVVRQFLGAAPLEWTASFVLAFLAVGAGLALTAVSGWLIVRASEQPAIVYLMVAIVGVRFFGIGRAAARYSERLATHRAVLAATDDLRLRLWRGIAARGAGSRDLREGGRAVDHLLGAVGEVRDLLPRTLVPIAVGLAAVVGVSVTVALLAPGVAILAVAGSLLALVVPVLLAVAGGRSAERARVDAGSRIVRRIAGLGTAAADLRGNDADARALAAFDDDVRRAVAAERRAAPALESAAPVAGLIAGLAAVAAAAVLAVTAAPSTTIAVVALLLLAVGEPLAAAAAGAARLPALATALTASGGLLATAASTGSGRLGLGAAVSRLELEGLAVGWPGSGPVASGLEAAVEPGSWLVVEGSSGSGKSTLLTALLGDLPAVAGRILVDGRELGAIRADAWRARVAWCPQDAHVFASSLRGNLVIARPRSHTPDAAELESVLREVGLGELLADLRDGLDAHLGAGGRQLSGGERQRVAVARALLADAEVVLLDEPTAHLDDPAATALIDDLRRVLADRIVVLVTHRAADRRPGDTILRLDPVAVERAPA